MEIKVSRFTSTSTQSLMVGLMACALAGVIHASDENVDFDSSVDFNKLHTFQFLPNPKSKLATTDPIMDERVQNMIIQAFIGQGLTQVSENPDLQVSYTTTTQQNEVLNTFGPGVGFGIGWRRWGGVGMATTTVSTFTEGTLVIDAWTLDPKQMVWRGTAQSDVESDPQKTTENIQKSINKLFEKWDRLKQKDYGD